MTRDDYGSRSAIKSCSFAIVIRNRRTLSSPDLPFIRFHTIFDSSVIVLPMLPLEWYMCKKIAQGNLPWGPALSGIIWH
jgi:hypothetical protein